MSAANVQIVEQIQAVLTVDDVVASLDDPESDVDVEEAFERLAVPDVECAMVGPETAGSVTMRGTGLEGFRTIWTEWMSPFESFRIEVEEVIDAGDKVLSLVHQTGVTKTGGVQIESRAAAVWTIRDGKVTQVEFHLDVDAAKRAAGLSSEPQSSQE
jgi:ketosteroid isomerase-like protein